MRRLDAIAWFSSFRLSQGTLLEKLGLALGLLVAVSATVALWISLPVPVLGDFVLNAEAAIMECLNHVCAAATLWSH